MKYQDIEDFFLLSNYAEEEEVNLLETSLISKEAFKIALSLKEEEMNALKLTIQEIYLCKFYQKEEMAHILNIFLLNYQKKYVFEFMGNKGDTRKYIDYVTLEELFAEIQDDKVREFLYNDIWNYSSKMQLKAIRIFKESIKKYPGTEAEATIREILGNEVIIKYYRDYEISVFISLCQNKYAKQFLLEHNQDQINILEEYTFPNIETCLKYINSIRDNDESIIEFAVNFLKKYNLRLFCSNGKTEPTIEDIGSIIDLFFADNNIHFDLDSNESIWKHLRDLDEDLVSTKQTMEGKKALIQFLTENPEDDRIRNLLLGRKVLINMDGTKIIELYNEIIKNPLENPSCELAIYEELRTTLVDKIDEILYGYTEPTKIESILYEKIKECANITEYITTVDEYLKKCDDIRDLLDELKKNEIDDFNLKTEIKIYKREN